MFFAADDGVTGRELHAVPLADADAWVAEAFGYGCGPAGGDAPRVATSGAAVIGGTLTAGVTHAEPLAPTLFLYSTAASPYLPLGDGCTLYFGLPFFSAVTQADGDGVASLDLPVPSNPNLVGATLAGQFIAVDGLGPFQGTSWSDGLEIVIGP